MSVSDPMDYSLPGSSPWISEARILEWIAIFFPRGSSQPRDQSPVSCKSPVWQDHSFFFLLKSCWALGARFLSCDEIPPYIKHLFGPITSSLCALEARGPHEKNAGVFTALLCGE